MNAEEALKEALKDAMSAHVADVRAPAMTGQAVRRRHRAHVTRFRATGAAVLTVLVAAAVPAYTALTSGPGAAPPVPGGALTGPAIPSEGVTLSADSTSEVDVTSPPSPMVTVSPTDSATAVPTRRPTDDPANSAGNLPEDLGDLGDGRAFGGIRVGYLPDGLIWGKWSGKNGFGTTSYTTTYVTPEQLKSGEYSVQIVVFEDEAARRAKSRLRAYRNDPGATKVSVHGAGGVVASLGEGSEVTANAGTPTILWFAKPGLAVEVMMSPVMSEGLGPKGTERELKKIANGVRATS
ncbi:hypothetical protein DQ384_10025 [Sphaerisporangium album]|uniref:Uncharacterized protein n=1 Tax=Sphaerisporangium album TaxID=509200 RepID=A0A367FNL2_9ACTN|nr:hypothetical protein [Sphaerisporangium album]RCG31851.1 hypothetical protein DQ384_10025 [Sphaerisporangium album]